MFNRDTEQQLFEETTQRFLDESCPPSLLREGRQNRVGYDRAFWRQGAELGWTSLTLPEELGGGSVSENPVKDLALVAYQFGLHAAPGPLVGTNVVAAALGRWGGGNRQTESLGQLLSGEVTAAWAPASGYPEPGSDTVRATATPDGYMLEGCFGPVQGGVDSAFFLVAAATTDGPSHFFLERELPGLAVTPLRNLDLSQRFVRLDLDRAVLPADSLVGSPGGAQGAVEWLGDLAVAIQLAEMCGAMQWSFEHTLEWARNRYSFGRPLASYQEIKHRFADMKLWLEASLAIAGDAARAVGANTPERAEVVSAGKFYVGRNGLELMQDCVQMHGGIGVTFDHDLHLFLRRVVTDAVVFGSSSQHAQRLCSILAEKESANAPD